MILKLLTGGIDLPKLAQRVKDLDQNHQQTNAALGDHIAKANTRMTTIENVVSSRALAEDVETLKQRLERDDEDNIAAFDRLNRQVSILTKQVDALTAAKLGEVKARKAPKK